MAFDEFNIQDDGEFNQKVPSLKEIALLHIKKISDICCNEFTKGRWEEKPIKVGGGVAITRKYIPDQRAVFCNAVDFLLWLIYPYSDKEFKAQYNLNGQVKGDKTGDTSPKSKSPSDNVPPNPGDKKGDEWEKKIEERKKIFIDIMIMFHRTNYFDSQQGQTE